MTKFGLVVTDDAPRAVRQLADDSVTGVCAFNDETAIAVLAGMREHGLAAPADNAVICSRPHPHHPGWRYRG